MFEWSASKINIANYCRRRYFLIHVLKDAPLLLGSYRRGKLIHNLIQNFWDKLGVLEEIKRNKKGKITSDKKYSNAEEFVEHAQGQWMYIMKQDESADRELSWSYDNEKWAIFNFYMPEICTPLFSELKRQGKPLVSELEFNILFQGRRFTGFIDELRESNGDVIVRDYKTEWPWMKGMKLAGNPQLTIYSFAVCEMLKKDKNFANLLGIDDVAEFMGDSSFISHRIKPEFFMVDTLRREPQEVHEMPQLIYKTERTDNDFRETLLFLDDVEHTIIEYLGGERKTISPTERGKKCDYCDMRVSCLERLAKELSMSDKKILVDSTGQQYFNYVSPHQVKPDKTITRKMKQRRFRWEK